MVSLFQSGFLQALGYAIANSLWQTALVWLVFVLVNSIFKLSASHKYCVAVAAQAVSFIWFLVTLQFYYAAYHEWMRQAGNSNSFQHINTLFVPGTGFRSQVIGWMVKAEQLLPYLSIAYLALLLFLSVRWLLDYRRTQTIRTSGIRKIPVDWRLFVKKAASQLGISRSVQIYLSETIQTPMTIGFFKPLILVPVASINHLTVDQLEAVILHELAHIKRHDYVVNIILSIAEISLFFNPFTQLLSKTIRKERENSCDDWVLQFQYNAAAYAEALLQIAYLQTIPAFAMTAVHDQNDLLGRVKRIIDKRENHFNYRRQLLAFFLVTAILSSIAWFNPAGSPARQPVVTRKTATQAKMIQPVVAEPMAMKVSNPLFNPAFFLTEPLRKEMKRRKYTEVIESVTPMVAEALNKASGEISSEKMHWNPEMASSKEAIAMSLKKIDTAFQKVRMDWHTSMAMKENLGFDEEKIKSEIAQAFNEVKKINLDQLVFNSMKMADIRFEKLPELRKSRRIPRQHDKEMEQPGEMPGMKIQEHDTTAVGKEKTVFLRAEDNSGEGLTHLADALPQYAVSPAQLQAVMLNKMKLNALLLRVAQMKQAIIIRPVVMKEHIKQACPENKEAITIVLNLNEL